MSRLKKCPFCGRAGVYQQGGNYFRPRGWTAGCPEGHAGSPEKSTKGEAAEWWNTRPAEPKAQQDAPTGAEITEYLGELGDSIYIVVDGERVLLDKLKLARAILDRYAPAQDAERERDAGIEAAARWIDTRRDDFDREHGYEDPDTGALEYGTGPHAEAKREYSFELAEIAEGLRALKSEAARAQLDAAQEKPE